MATIWDKSHGGRLTITTPMGTLFTVQHRSGKCKAHIRWNKDVGANLTRAMVTGRGKLMQRIIRDTHPLVPFDTGMLDNSAQLATDYETGEIIWSNVIGSVVTLPAITLEAESPTRITSIPAWSIS